MTAIEPVPSLASDRHDAQTPQGSGVGPFSQFSDRARMRALEVLPQPRGPENRYAWCTLPLRSACCSGPVTCSWPLTSANVPGRYLRYRARLTKGLHRSKDPSRTRPEPACPCCLPALGEFSEMGAARGVCDHCSGRPDSRPVALVDWG